MNKIISLLVIFLLANDSLTWQQRLPPPTPPPQTTTTKSPSAITTTTIASTTTSQPITTTTHTTTTTTASSLPMIITAWKKSSGVGYSNYVADVTSVKYDSTYVYVSSNSIPSYSIGPWASNPNKPTPQNSTFKFYRNPSYGSTKTSMRLGAVGLWINGLYVYNGWDGQSYNSLNVWQRDAYVWEGVSFDKCNGHPDGFGRYHNHISIDCYYNSTDMSKHSPLLGFIFDSYPIYGPFGYSNANDSSSTIRRMVPGYELRNITKRTSLADGTVLTSTYYGPDVNTTYPLGSYIQDYSFTGNGDLDVYNGRWCVTPEFPSGTYAYFVTTDSSNKPKFPYLVGLSYFGNVASTAQTSAPSTSTTYF